jgi:hypothetical protein
LLLWALVLIALLFWSWTSSAAPQKFALLFLSVWCFPLAFFMLRVPRQHQRVESLRMSVDEVPLFQKQPAYDVTDLPVPVTLTMKLSRGTYLFFAVFWLLMLGIVIVFQTPTFLAWQILWQFIAGWLMLGALVLGLCVLAFYQRIEVTSESLMVQHGWKRGRIPWTEARLFAVINLDEQELSRANAYELSSARTILRWTHAAVGAGFSLSPGDREEYKRLLEELRAFIRIQTGLMVRDLQ